MIGVCPGPTALSATPATACSRVSSRAKSSVSAVADNQEVRDVASVSVEEDHDRALTMLFDADHSFEERVLVEQFSV